ncbi:probable F-box protein At2g36090 [Sesamum indicum]|uniref:Probable F-box protein At2g36090 n=1 Tax=Sesamum indicum TaxID=4182 RepID=A0A6I9T2R3_SESIN|nr:probable F-box protein At2g36090 [Sesamum indicum]
MNSPPPSAAEAGFSTLHPDVIESHILTRLDGPALASAACCSTTFHRGSSQDHLWSSICHSTWPSTASPSVSQVVSTFPDGGPRAFFSHAFPLVEEASTLVPSSSAPPTELLSAVDIHHRGQLIFTKLQKTETDKEWFRRLPFRIDLLEPKDVVPTPIKYPVGDGACAEILEGMTLSWILIDPIGRRAANLSSHEPVTVQRRWLTGEVQARFATILAADQGHVQCGIVVTWGRSEGGVREVSLEMEDMDGKHLNGKDSLVILQGAMEGKKGTGKKRVEEGLRRYREYAEMKRERGERKLMRERALDLAFMAFGIFINAAFWCYVFL